MSERLRLTILSPEKRLIEKLPVDEVTLPGSEGQLQILPGHIPFIGSLHTGIFQYRAAGTKPVSGVISFGFFEVTGNDVRVMAETLELEGAVDLVRAKKAQLKAEETLATAHLDAQQFRKYELKLQRALIRQSLTS